jgi:hypothetical protein
MWRRQSSRALASITFSSAIAGIILKKMYTPTSHAARWREMKARDGTQG